MPIRGIVLFHIGGPFTGFQIRPPRPGMLGPDDSDVYRALELAIADMHKVLVSQPPTAWSRLAEAAAVPRISGRKVKLDLASTAANDLDGDVIARAWLPFRAWPFGGWVVFEGWHRTREGSWTEFTAEELEKIW